MSPFDPKKFAPEGDSGGRESKPYSGNVIDAYFTEGTYGIQLVLKTALDEADAMLYPWMTSGEDTRWFGVGKISVTRGEKWVPWSLVGDGLAVKGDKEDRMFRADSDAGRLVAALFALPGVEGLPDDFDPRAAKSWKGLHITWGPLPVTRQRKNESTDKYESYTADMDLPVALGGVSSAPAPEVDLAAFGLTEDQLHALMEIDHTLADPQWASAALSVLGLASNQQFVIAISNNVAGVRAAVPF